MAELLTLDDVTAGYGEAVIIEGVSLAVAEGDTLAVLGRNGMGKSTLLKTIVGLTALKGGKLCWRGRDFGAEPVHARVGAGLGWAPQERGMFASLTVEEHLTAVERPGAWNLERVYRLFPRLAERRSNLGHRLSGGEQQMLAIGRALVTNPALLLLDEPMEGLAPIMVQDLKRAIRKLTEETGMAVVLVEQHARLALSLTRNAVVLERGRIALRDTSEALLHEPDLLDRLLSVTQA